MLNLQDLNVPTRSWVPQWLGLITVIMVLIPLVLINGAYTGDITEVSGTLGVMSEDIRMAYYATSVGMAVSYPLASKIRLFVTPKTVLLVDYLIQVTLSLVCAKVEQMDIVIICSFLIGFFKGFAMLEIINMIRPYFSPDNIRSEFYPFYYPIVFSAGQVSMALTAQLAYSYQWQHMYYFVVILLLLAIFFILAFFRYARTPVHIPFKDMDGKSALLAATALLFIIYVFTYGKTLDWFSSSKIMTASLAAPVLVWLFFHRQNTSKKPYVRLEILNGIKPTAGYFFMMVTMFFSSSSSLITSYTGSILHVDSVHTNALYLWMLPGFVLGGIICFRWFRWQRWRFRVLISAGMFCYVIYFAILYFCIEPGGTYEMLYLPMFLRGVGMMILIIALGVYVVEDMNRKLLINNAFFLISLRSALASALSTSFYANILYRFQMKAMNVLCENMTMDNTLAASQYSSALKKALAQGHSMTEAVQMATNSLYGTLQTQSLLLALKTVLGYMLILSLVIAIVCRFLPFHKSVKMVIVKGGDDMV